MTAVDRVLLILPRVALSFSVAELAVTAYVASVFNRPYTYRSFGVTTTIRIPVPSSIGYLIFCAIWSMLALIAMIVAPRFLAKRAIVTDEVYAWSNLVLTTLTMLFWLSGFANVATVWDGTWGFGGSWSAMLAFAVILWLMFLALTILNFLTAFAVLKSERRGYQTMFRKGHSGGAHIGTTQPTYPQNSMNSMNQMGQMNQMNQMGHMNQTGQMNQMGQMGHNGYPNQMNQMGQMGHNGYPNQMGDAQMTGQAEPKYYPTANSRHADGV